MRALLLMFVMLTSSITIAQDGLYLVFDCDRPLRLERQAAISALGNAEVFATVAVTSNPKTTTTSIFNKFAFAYNKSEEGHIEDWDETTTYADYFQDLSDRVDGQIVRNERLIILEAAFIQYSTDAVSISLTSDANGNDVVLFDGGAYSLTHSFDALIEDLYSLNQYILLFSNYVSRVEAELKSIALAANETAYSAALDSNTASSSEDREIELEGLSRDGVVVKITLQSPGYDLEFNDADGNNILDSDGDPLKYAYGTNLDSVSDYGTSVYNNAVTKVRDLVKDLINN